jgi:glyoxylase-like metal-dependent hydrolase (beta-lactamase superfamily II)
VSSRAAVQRPAAWTRFQLGNFVCTIISDGRLEFGDPRYNYQDVDPDEFNAVLREYHLPDEKFVLRQNLLIVENGQKVILFDCGVGLDPNLGLKYFGPNSGHALDNLRAAGFDPSEIDIVALTHAHPDHCWGLVDIAGQRVFPNAEIAVSQEELDRWLDLKQAESAPDEHTADMYIGAYKSLTPYADRLIIVEDGSTVIPGIEAMATPGHTPGHMAYKVESEGEGIVVWGDISHDPIIELRMAEWVSRFDIDKAAAVASRHKICDFVAQHGYQVLSQHYPFPGHGYVRKSNNGYEWLPVPLNLETLMDRN